MRRLWMVFCVAACGGAKVQDPVTPGDPVPTVVVDTAKIPLSELGTRTYLGFTGGLYPGGSNEPPVDHAAAGRNAAAAIIPLDAAGVPSPSGRYVLLSIGLSNTTQEFCGGSASNNCKSWTFMPLAAADSRVNHSSLVILDGAAGGQVTDTWDEPTDVNYDRVRDAVLKTHGVTEAQVQIAWVKLANKEPHASLPSESADAYALERGLGGVVRAARARYPNLRQIFFSNRIYAGYATSILNPEPYAYETGLSVKWLVESQIVQRRAGTIDSRAGNLSTGVAPWIGWGPDLWARGSTPRSDGLVWLPADFETSDFTHPGPSGEAKVANLLMQHFTTSPFASCWFLAARTCT